MSLNETLLRRVSSAIAAPFVRAAISLHVSPNALTLVGFSISLVAAALIGMNYLLVGGAVLLIGGLFDMLDGARARTTAR